jgi:2-oxopent-4-enoate hydratase
MRGWKDERLGDATRIFPATFDRSNLLTLQRITSLSLHDDIAASLWQAQQKKTAIAAPTDEHPDLTLNDAYAIQRINLDRRMSERRPGATPPRRVGWKVGITSVAIQSWLGVSEPDFGGLLCDMDVPDGGDVDVDSFLQPRVEAEIAFVLKKSLVGPGITAAQALAAIDFAIPAIEIIDSRVIDWKFKIQDTIADNASSAMFVVGNRPMRLHEVDLRLVGATLRRNGRVVSTGAGAACLGHPVNAVVWLANKLGDLGEQLNAGQVILSGALGPVSPVVSGDVISASVGPTGHVTVAFR